MSSTEISLNFATVAENCESKCRLAGQEAGPSSVMIEHRIEHCVLRQLAWSIAHANSRLWRLYTNAVRSSWQPTLKGIRDEGR